VDIPALEAAFLRIFEWVQGGKPDIAFGDRPFRWLRGDWVAHDIQTSPVGPFKAINGRDLMAYMRPQRKGFGYLERIDLRAGTTPEMLLAAAEVIDRPNADAQPITTMRAARNAWWDSVCLQGDPIRRPNLAADAFAAGYKAAIERAAAIAAYVTPSSTSATGETHLRSYRDAIVHEIRKELP
jgi:hypothetical protein